MRSAGHILCSIIFVGLVTACGGSSTTPSEPEALLQAGGTASEEVCHLAQTKIDVPIQKLEEHLAHGDWIVGPEICDGEDNDCDGRVDEGRVCDGTDPAPTGGDGGGGGDDDGD